MESSVKKERNRTRSVTDCNMLLMVKKGIRGRMCHDIQKYAKANKKYVKDYDINIEM